MANIYGVNANLLVVLDVLLQERNVTRAARRVGVTQASMSGNLAQLRELLGDPLLVRHGRTMVPTPRALELHDSLSAAVRQLENVVQSAPAFDPMVSDRRFVVAMNDFAAFVIVPKLLERLRVLAPHTSLQTLPWGRHAVPEELATGQLDLMAGFYRSADLRPDFREQNLFETGLVTIARRDHPRIGRRLTLDRFLDESHVVITENVGGGGIVDRMLARTGRTRRVGARIPHFLMAPVIVAQTDLIATVEPHIAHFFAEGLGLRTFKPPFEIYGRGIVGMVWHRRTDADPACAWLRDQLTDLTAAASRRR